MGAQHVKRSSAAACRLLSTKPQRLRVNLAHLKHQLTLVGLDARQLDALLLKYPLLLALSPITLNAKLQRLKVSPCTDLVRECPYCNFIDKIITLCCVYGVLIYNQT